MVDNMQMTFVPKGPIDVQVVAWCLTYDKPLPESMLTYCQQNPWE